MPLFEHLGQDYEANLRYVQNLFWNSVGQFFRETSAPNQINKTKDVRELQGDLSPRTPPNMRGQIPPKHINLDSANIDHVPSSGTHSGHHAMLFVLEDNEAVIKMIIKGRSPTMRHVSRTHRVALGWLFDRINLDSKIQIRYIDTKHQLADILTKGNFTRDQRNNLLHLFNISHFSSACCAKNSSLVSCPKTMAKRVQEQKEEERIVAKSRPTAMNLSSTVPASSSSAKDPIASKSPEKLIASGKPESRVRRNSKPDAASSSQVELQDAHLGGLMENFAGKPVAKNQVLWEFFDSESWSNHDDEVTAKPVTHKTATGKPVASSNSENSGNPEAPHDLHISPAVVPHMDTVFSIVRKIYD